MVFNSKTEQALEENIYGLSFTIDGLILRLINFQKIPKL